MPKHLKWPEKIFKYAVAAMILSVLLYPKFPFISIPGISVSVRLEDIVILTVFGLWFFTINFRNFFKSKINLAFILFLSAGLISLFAGIFLTNTVEPAAGFFHWARRVEYLAAFFIGVAAVRSKEDLFFYLKLLILVVVLAFFYGVGQRYFNVPIVTTQNEEYARGIALRWREGAHLVSTFAGHYDLASFLILIFPTLYLLLFAKPQTLRKFIPDTKPIITKSIIFIVVLMALWLITQSASRISLVSYLGSSILALALAGRRKFIPVVVVLSFIFASLSMNLVDRYLNFIDVYAQELPEAAVVPEPVPIEDRSTSIRVNVEWPRAIRALTKNPITGTGYSSITLATDNDYLRMLGETGILGFLSFWLAFGSIIFVVVKNFPSPSSPEGLFVIGTFSAISGVLLNMVFIDLLEASKFAITFWLMLGFVVGIPAQGRNDKENL
jgi:O-antigen ligase